MSDFKAFSDIERLTSQVSITEKIHGSNAQILIEDVCEEFDDLGEPKEYGRITTTIKAGSRTRWLEPGPKTDNYGFAAWVEANKDALIKALGPGRHFGEWYGSGINSGYGLKDGDRRFALFNTVAWYAPYAAGVLPKGVEVVPLLFRGPFREGLIQETMTKLKLQGSSIQPGFMRPEGIVVRFDRNGALFKHVFEAEETGWSGSKKEKTTPYVEGELQAKLEELKGKVALLLQPIRLEKLLSRDESFTRDYPKSLPALAKAYSEDMSKEGQWATAEERVAAVARKNIFPWIKHIMAEKGYAA